VCTDREIEIPFPTIQRNTNIYTYIHNQQTGWMSVCQLTLKLGFPRLLSVSYLNAATTVSTLSVNIRAVTLMIDVSIISIVSCEEVFPTDAHELTNMLKHYRKQLHFLIYCPVYKNTHFMK